MGFSKTWKKYTGKDGAPKPKKARDLRKQPADVNAEIEKLNKTPDKKEPEKKEPDKKDTEKKTDGGNV